MTPSKDTYGRIQLAFMMHGDPEGQDYQAAYAKVMAAWGATDRTSNVTMADLPSDIQQIVTDMEASPLRGTPQGYLHYRLSDALGTHEPDGETRTAIVDGYLAAGGDYATWDDLTPQVQVLIEELETKPRSNWDDPADGPDEDPYEPDLPGPDDDYPPGDNVPTSI